MLRGLLCLLVVRGGTECLSLVSLHHNVSGKFPVENPEYPSPLLFSLVLLLLTLYSSLLCIDPLFCPSLDLWLH